MNPLILRTALPFGYLLFACILLLLFGSGVVLLVRGVRVRNHLRIGVGALFVGVAMCVFIVNITADKTLDENPHITGLQELIGVWQGKNATLELLTDNTFRCIGDNCGALGQEGKWQRDGDFGLRLLPRNASSMVYRIVSYQGKLRLIHNYNDPDLWDGSFLFEHTASSSAYSPLASVEQCADRLSCSDTAS